MIFFRVDEQKVMKQKPTIHPDIGLQPDIPVLEGFLVLRPPGSQPVGHNQSGSRSHLDLCVLTKSCPGIWNRLINIILQEGILSDLHPIVLTRQSSPVALVDIVRGLCCHNRMTLFLERNLLKIRLPLGKTAAGADQKIIGNVAGSRNVPGNPGISPAVGRLRHSAPASVCKSETDLSVKLTFHSRSSRRQSFFSHRTTSSRPSSVFRFVNTKVPSPRNFRDVSRMFSRFAPT